MGTEMEPAVSAIILAGGQARRFDGEDKGLIVWQGAPLIQHVITRIRPQLDDIAVSCNRHLEQYRGFGLPVYSDRLADYQGPLAGVQTIFPHLQHQLVLISPCDTPKLPDNLVNRLLTILDQQQTDVAYARCGQRHHYLPVLIRRHLASSLDQYLLTGGRSLKGWFQDLKVSVVEFDDDNAFNNINNADDLKSEL
ncbi:MAG: molybdopterin-guanine dinucleotide biosynthesis protein A [Oceanicoccus sp.]|jgi:molybdopterin-guanine dinucleotide biosynthesis protein A